MSKKDTGHYITPECLANWLVKRLSRYGAFIYSHSADRVSWYLHFSKLPDNATHKMRISNHNERAQYGYKWQLRIDGLRRIRNPREYTFYFDDAEILVEKFERYYQAVSWRLENEASFPSHTGQPV